MYTDQRLMRARAFEPIAAIGDVLYLLDQSGPIKKYASPEPYFLVMGIEPVPAIAPHGLLILWSQSAAGVAGYGLAPGNQNLIPEAQTGSIVAGASTTISNPRYLQGGPLQLIQYRFSVKPLALTGPKEHDMELQVFSPGKLGKFGLANAAPGFINMADQFQDPVDGIDSPAQGANQTLPAAFPAVAARDQQNLGEFFVWEVNGPSFTIWNNGSATLSAGLIGLRLWAFRYDLVPVDPALFAVKRWVYGNYRAAPNTDRPIIIVPTAPYTGTPSTQ